MPQRNDLAGAAKPITFTTPWLHDGLTPGGRPMGLTDLGNAERFAIAHGDDLRFVHPLRQWLYWNGLRFARDDSGEVRRRTKQTMRNILLEAASQDNEEQRKQLIAHQIRSESEHGIRAAMALAESDERIAALAEQFDADPMLLNLSSGTLDLRTCKLHQHRREEMLTKLAPIAFDPNATAPTWGKFISEIMAGDEDTIQFLRRAIGYSLTGDVGEHCFFLLHGVGANGKTTLLEVLRNLLGDYAMQADFSTFLATKGGGIRNDIARLRGARLVTAVESDAGRRLAENILKHLTGGDTVAARFLYSEHFEFVPTFKVWLATNNRPRIIGTDEAIWRRVRLLPFTVTIPPEARDPKLAEKLKGERSGILNWALAGHAEWRERGLTAPKVIVDAGAEYREAEDALGRFLDDCVTADPKAETRTSEIYKYYRQWAESGGEFPLREKDFAEAMEQRGFRKVHTKTGNFWRSLHLRGDLFGEG